MLKLNKKGFVLEKIKKFCEDFEVKNTLFFLMFFYVCAIGFSAYKDYEQLKKDCANPITKECTSNILWNSFIVIPQIFGYDINNKITDNNSQQKVQ